MRPTPNTEYQYIYTQLLKHANVLKMSLLDCMILLNLYVIFIVRLGLLSLWNEYFDKWLVMYLFMLMMFNLYLPYV